MQVASRATTMMSRLGTWSRTLRNVETLKLDSHSNPVASSTARRQSLPRGSSGVASAGNATKVKSPSCNPRPCSPQAPTIAPNAAEGTSVRRHQIDVGGKKPVIRPGPSVGRDRHAGQRLGGADGERGLDAGDIGCRRQVRHEGFLKALQVAGDDLEDEVDLAVEHVAFAHFG